jgi:hypothetical protein
MLLSGVAFQASAHDLPLGDGKVSSGPKVGYVFSCQQRFNPNAPGAQASGDWLGKTTWNPEKKPYVRGSVSWPSAITIQVEGSERVVRANNLPSHPTGIFPIQRDDPAYQYDRNPGRITEQDIVLKLPAVPSAAAKPSCVPMGMVGFSTTNVAIFNALDARGDDAPAHEIQDKCGGHPQQTGQYHYHNLSPCLEDARSQSGGHSDLVAYAADGFGLFGKYGANGKQVTNADLDGCHGHSHTIEWDGTAQNIYHYHMTEAYPYTVGCFKGTPVSLPDTGMGLQGGQQQRPAPGQGGQRGQGGGQGGPQQALATAAAELGVSANQLRRALGPPPPNFQSAARKLGISADRIRRAMQNARGR